MKQYHQCLIPSQLKNRYVLIFFCQSFGCWELSGIAVNRTKILPTIVPEPQSNFKLFGVNGIKAKHYFRIIIKAIPWYNDKTTNKGLQYLSVTKIISIGRN